MWSSTKATATGCGDIIRCDARSHGAAAFAVAAAYGKGYIIHYDERWERRLADLNPWLDPAATGKDVARARWTEWRLRAFDAPTPGYRAWAACRVNGRRGRRRRRCDPAAAARPAHCRRGRSGQSVGSDRPGTGPVYDYRRGRPGGGAERHYAAGPAASAGSKIASGDRRNRRQRQPAPPVGRQYFQRAIFRPRRRCRSSKSPGSSSLRGCRPAPAGKKRIWSDRPPPAPARRAGGSVSAAR